MTISVMPTERLLRACRTGEPLTVVARGSDKNGVLRNATRVLVVEFDAGTATLQLKDGTLVHLPESDILDPGEMRARLAGNGRLARFLEKISWL